MVGEKMKKIICTLTAVAFSLGLAGAGLAQTATKEAEKPAVKKEAPAVPVQVTPAKEAVKSGEAAKPAAKEGCKEPVKTGEKVKKGKETKKSEKKTGVPVEKPKEGKK